MHLGIPVVSFLLTLPCLDARVFAANSQDSSRIAMCRANCLKTYDFEVLQGRRAPQCYFDLGNLMGDCIDVCWTNCEKIYLQPNFHSKICDNSFCDSSCMTACNHYKQEHTVNYEEKVNSFFFPRKITFDSAPDGVLVTWKKPVMRNLEESNEKFVYVVKVSKNGENWIEVNQTIDENQVIPEPLLMASSSIRVTAISSGGIGAQQDILYKHSQVYKDLHTLKGHRVRWIPELVSQSHNKEYSEVEAVVTWPKAPNEFTNFLSRYEVSWKIKDNEKKGAGIEIIGHLYTETNIAVLSLRPHAVYEIQVEYYSKTLGTLKSEPLIVQTKNIVKPNHIVESMSKFCTGCDLKIFLLCGACSSFILALIAIYIVRKRNRDRQVEAAEISPSKDAKTFSKSIYSKAKEFANYEKKFFDEKLTHLGLYKTVHHKPSSSHHGTATVTV